ncbi:putative LPXTG cell wall anchor [Erwinia phage vB_EamM_Yoloswag]|uniref:Putative LPXTG cell wall anchor n=1 Tax=Erwinia phage vB_EamM_Yoloswag TaxID=1958956 RepID=A0A1S6L3E3_9CAUD|nr:putative LPXTG cell wall anchor [Erwinia phage vB_EamM_Yoloswag]AQT28697.1 putative LPXTG cell wall anchor [Erwinia phage vB_EamM_Yoloswag]
MAEITLEQYKELLSRNVLNEPAFIVSNRTVPQGDIGFQVLGENLKMKSVIIPAGVGNFDLTHLAPLAHLLASSDIKALLDKRMIALMNPGDMPEPSKTIDQPTIDPAVEGSTVVTGTTVPNATVFVIQGDNTWRSTSDSSGRFSVPVSGLVEGEYRVLVNADGYAGREFTFTAGARPNQDYPLVTNVQGEYRGTHITGTTVPNADVSATFDGKSFDDTADSNGAFDITTDPLPFQPVTLTFAADGYNTHEQQFTPAQISMANLSIDTPAYFDTEISGSAEPESVVTVAPDGQQEVTADVADNGDYTATIQPLRGAVKVYANAAGFRQTETTAQPNRQVLGNITVNSVADTDTEVSGNVADVNPAANDLTIEVVTQNGQVNGTVAADGSFIVQGVDLTKGTTGTVTIKSAEYEDKQQQFSILQSFDTFTVNQLDEGQPVTGNTVANTNITLTQGENTASGSSNAQGAFSINLTNAHSGPVDVALSRNGYVPENLQAQLVVTVLLDVDAFAIGATSVTGNATPNATVEFVQDQNTAQAVADTDGEFTITLTDPTVAGNYTVTATLENFEARSASGTLA